MIRVVEKIWFIVVPREKEKERKEERRKKNCEITIGSRSRETRDQMHILQEFSRPCIFSKLAFLRVIVTLYGFAYAFRDKSTVRKCAYATYFLPVSSRYVSSVRVCVYVHACMRVCLLQVCAGTRARARACTSPL